MLIVLSFILRKDIVEKYSDEKSPVKSSKYSIGNHYASISLVMNKKTFFKDASKPNFESDQGKESEVVSMKNLNKFAAELLIAVKAKIINLSGVKVVPLANKTLRKWEIDFSDPTETSKLFLWEESCKQSLESDITYILSNFKLNVRCRSRY